MSVNNRDKSKVLTTRQYQFCQAFVQQNSNATIAAKAAGYGSPSRRGSELCKRPEIQEAIQLLRGETLETQSSTLNRNSQIKLLGKMVTDTTIPTMSRIRAIELLNKMMGWNEPEKQEVTQVIRDTLEMTIKKCTRLLVEHGYKVIAP